MLMLDAHFQRQNNHMIKIDIRQFHVTYFDAENERQELT